MKPLKPLLLVAMLLMAAWVGYATHDAQGGKKVDTRVFELRTYYIHPGRMKAMNARFRDHTNKLLEKHGMKLVGFWTPTKAEDADKQLIYIVEHASEAAAKKSWDTFRADPDWQAARDASEKDGKIVDKVVSTFLQP